MGVVITSVRERGRGRMRGHVTEGLRINQWCAGRVVPLGVRGRGEGNDGNVSTKCEHTLARTLSPLPPLSPSPPSPLDPGHDSRTRANITQDSYYIPSPLPAIMHRIFHTLGTICISPVTLRVTCKGQLCKRFITCF